MPDTQTRRFEIQKDPNEPDTEDVIVRIESHPDYQRVIEMKGEETRRETKIGVTGTQRAPTATALHGDVPEWARPVLTELGIRDVQ